ncbi:MAG: hypothetical protein ABI378_03460 [Chitinophagaceae bacterium]
MLFKPFLANCGDRNILPKVHPTSGTPEDWFSHEILGQFNLAGITFDFFVNWKSVPNSLTPVIWIKRILLPEYNYEQAIEDLEDISIKEFGTKQLDILWLFGTRNKLAIQFIIFRDDLDWCQSEGEVLIVDFIGSEASKFSFDYSLVTLDRFKAQIREYSGGSIKIGTKGLLYGTSNLECHLSKTNSLYPGDADLIIIDNETNPMCILEFKKHTMNTSISLQQLSNYYPHPDGRKYNRLEILRHYLSRNTQNIPLFVVYYPTNLSFTEAKLELLTGDAGKLSTKAASNFLLPSKASGIGYSKIVEKLINAIAYHHTQNAK